MSTQPRIFNVPRIVLILIGAMTAIHLVRQILPDEEHLRFLLTMAFIPARYGGEAAALLPGGYVSAVTSFVTYMLIHGDLTHLAINCLWMLAFGSLLARRCGAMRFLLFSCACGIAGAAMQLAFNPGALIPVVGASAAISGQMSAAIRLIFGSPGSMGLAGIGGDPRYARLAGVAETLRDPRALVFLGIWLALNLLFGLDIVRIGGVQGDIAWEAHLGGFLMGLLGFAYFDRPRAPGGHQWGPRPL